MRRLRAAAVLMCALVTASCTPPSHIAKISDDFGVCMRADRGTTYVKTADGPDYDVGVLTIGQIKVDVYIGYSVGFKGGDWSKVKKPNEGFVLLGTQVKGDRKKTMLGHRRQSRGPIIVLFDGPNDARISSVLERQDFIVDCDRSG